MKFTVKAIASIAGSILLLAILVASFTQSDKKTTNKLYAVTYFDGTISHSDFSDSIRFRDDKCVDYRAFPLRQWKKVCGQNIAVTDYFQE